MPNPMQPQRPGPAPRTNHPAFATLQRRTGYAGNPEARNNRPPPEDLDDDLIKQCRAFLAAKIPISNVVFADEFSKYMPLFNKDANADQSHADELDIKNTYPDAVVNPLGHWTGGTDVDTGAVNRKLGSDMGDSVTGGGLHGKDLSKADVSVNIYAFLKAQETGAPVELSCAIGDETIDGKPYEEIISIVGEYIKSVGGFEKFAEWGLIR